MRGGLAGLVTIVQAEQVDTPTVYPALGINAFKVGLGAIQHAQTQGCCRAALRIDHADPHFIRAQAWLRCAGKTRYQQAADHQATQQLSRGHRYAPCHDRRRLQGLLVHFFLFWVCM